MSDELTMNLDSLEASLSTAPTAMPPPPPQTPEELLSGADFDKNLATTLAFLATITTVEMYNLSEMRDFRKAITPISKLRDRTMWDGLTEEQYRDMQVNYAE